MKKIFSLFLFAGLLVFSLTLTNNAEAQAEFQIENGVLVQYNGKGPNVYIPQGVVEIGRRAFYNNDAIQTVTFSSTVKRVADDAFYDADGLRVVTFNPGLETIGEEAFYSTSGLQQVPNMPSSLWSIGRSAFNGASNLKAIDLQYVKNLGDYAFAASGVQDVNLKSIANLGSSVFYKGSVINARIEGTIDRISDDAFSSIYTNYKQLTGNLVIGSNIKTIGDGAFRNTGIVNLKLPSSVTKIERYAFYETYSLQTANLEGVKIIGEKAFNSSGIQAVNLRDIESLGYDAFYNAWRLTDIVIGNKIKIIPESAFAKYQYGDNNHVVNRLVIGNNVTSIGRSAFYLNRLANVTLPNKLVTIHESAFESNQLREVIIPETVTSIGESAFRNNPIEFFALGQGVTNLGYAALDGTNIKSINIPIGLSNIYRASYNHTIPTDTKIFGYDTSDAQAYAKEMGNPFQLISHGYPMEYFPTKDFTVTTPRGKSYTIRKGESITGTIENNTTFKFIYKGEVVSTAKANVGSYADLRQGWVNGKYYVNDVVQTGLTKAGQTTYLFDKNGNKVTGWVRLEGKDYYFSPQHGGGMLTGKRKVGQTTYIFNNAGYKEFGWKRLDGKDYYFDPNFGGGMVTGKRKIGQTTYVFHNNGYKEFGWKRLSNRDYYFDKNYGGGMVTGKRYVNGYYYIFHNQGYRVTGWHVLDGQRYYFNPNMYRSGRYTINGRSYYFNYNGTVRY